MWNLDTRFEIRRELPTETQLPPLAITAADWANWQEEMPQETPGEDVINDRGRRLDF